MDKTKAEIFDTPQWLIDQIRREQRNAPVLLQTQYITREDFDLLSYQDTNTLYYILEEDGTATMQKGVN